MNPTAYGDLDLLCSAPEKGIHRRDAENFVFSLAGGNPRVTLNRVGCKEGRARRENLFMFPLRLCGEFPFGCGYAALWDAVDAFAPLAEILFARPPRVGLAPAELRETATPLEIG
jgi:hypothetical protein